MKQSVCHLGKHRVVTPSCSSIFDASVLIFRAAKTWREAGVDSPWWEVRDTPMVRQIIGSSPWPPSSLFFHLGDQGRGLQSPREGRARGKPLSDQHYKASERWIRLLVSRLPSVPVTYKRYLKDGSAQTSLRAATMRWKLQVKLAASPSHSWPYSHWASHF